MKLSITFKIAGLILAAVILSAFCMNAPAAPKEPVVIADFTSGENKGIGSIVWKTDGVTTYYDAKTDRLADGAHGQARPGEFPGHPNGKNRGVLLESTAYNNLLNSSFENELASWNIASLVAAVTDGGLHGQKAAVLNGSGEIYQRLNGLTPTGKTISGCLSIYFQGDEQEIGKVIQPFVYVLEDGKRVRNLVWNIRYFRQPGSRWTRMAAYFSIPGGDFDEKFIYEAGLAVTGARELKMDAAQMEARGAANSPREKGTWISSYIPTLAKRRGRANEYGELKLSETLDLRQGTMTVWWHGVNPTPYILTLLRAPADPVKNVQLGGKFAVLGLAVANSRMPIHGQAWIDGWHLFAMTWRDGKGMFYMDGKEAGLNEGPFPYKEDELPTTVTHLLLGTSHHDDPEGCISHAAVYKEALSEEEIAALYGIPPAGANAKKPAGVAVEYTTPSDGTVSVGIFDKDGALLRQLAMGEKKDAGKHTLVWDGKDDDGQPVAAGKYAVRGAVNNITCKHRVGVGNTGMPPWGPSKVYSGAFVGVAASGKNLVTITPCCEFGLITQCFTDDGRKVWTIGGTPLRGELTAVAADAQYAYIAGVLTSEYDAEGRLHFSDGLYRIDLKDGSTAQWPGQKECVRLSAAKRKSPDGPMPKGFYWLNTKPVGKHLSEPFAYFGVRGLAVSGGKIYAPLFFENRILVLDALTGALTGEIKDIPEPQGVAVHDGVLYAASRNNIVRHDLKTGNSEILTVGLSAPYGVASAPNGDIYVTDLGDSQQVKVIAPTGKVKQIIGPQWLKWPKWDGNPDRLFWATGLTVDDKGNLTVSDYGNSRLAHYDATGRLTRSTECWSGGDMAGAALLAPGDTSRLWGVNHSLRNTETFGLVLWRMDLEKSTWQVAGRWQDISPLATHWSGTIRKLENGRTYLYVTGSSFMTIWDLTGDKPEFCSAFIAPRFIPLTHYAKPEIEEDAKALGLVKDGECGPQFNCRAVWTDHNRDCRMQKDEVVPDKTRTNDWWNCHAQYVDEQGNILVSGQNEPVMLLLRNGFDPAGNPLYDWKNTRTVMDATKLSKEPWFAREKYCLEHKTMDLQGNLYMGLGDGTCMPSKARLAKFGPDGRVMWKFGRLAMGVKDKPGEIGCTWGGMAVVDDIFYFSDWIDGVFDLLTTDGLYLTTLLKHGGIMEDDPYACCGENNVAQVVKDAQTGKVYIMQVATAFAFQIYEVLGLYTLQRFNAGDVTLDEQTAAKLAKIRQEQPIEEGDGIVYLTNRTITVDGDLSDWQGIPEKIAAMTDQEDLYSVKYRYACDGKSLKMAFSVQDDSPAINPLMASDQLWHGDLLELYFSRNPLRSGSWQSENFIIHIAPCPVRPAGKDNVGVYDAGVKGFQWISPPDLQTATKIWPDGKGYDLEVSIPLNVLGMQGMPAGTRMLMDWDFIYGTARNQDDRKGDYGFKLPRNPRIDANVYVFNKGTLFWNYARAVRRPGEEYAVYASPLSNGWDMQPVQAELKLDGMDEQYNSELKAAHDDKGLRFFVDVRDPDPAILRSSIVLNNGDWMEFFVDGREIYVVAADGYAEPYFLKGGQLSNIPGATSVIKRDKASYTLEIFIPWEAVGGRKDKYTFNWRMAWSDNGGMAALGTKLLRPEKEPASLAIVPR